MRRAEVEEDPPLSGVAPAPSFLATRWPSRTTRGSGVEEVVREFSRALGLEPPEVDVVREPEAPVPERVTLEVRRTVGRGAVVVGEDWCCVVGESAAEASLRDGEGVALSLWPKDSP